MACRAMMLMAILIAGLGALLFTFPEEIQERFPAVAEIVGKLPEAEVVRERLQDFSGIVSNRTADFYHTSSAYLSLDALHARLSPDAPYTVEVFANLSAAAVKAKAAVVENGSKYWQELSNIIARSRLHAYTATISRHADAAFKKSQEFYRDILKDIDLSATRETFRDFTATTLEKGRTYAELARQNWKEMPESSRNAIAALAVCFFGMLIWHRLRRRNLNVIDQREAMPVRGRMQISTSGRRSSSPGFKAPAEDLLLKMLNQSDVNGLMSVKGIGSKSAERIVNYRQQNGDLNSLNDLQSVGVHPSVQQRLLAHYGC